jgi:hypothetical protein
MYTGIRRWVCSHLQLHNDSFTRAWSRKSSSIWICLQGRVKNSGIMQSIASWRLCSSGNPCRTTSKVLRGWTKVPFLAGKHRLSRKRKITPHQQKSPRSHFGHNAQYFGFTSELKIFGWHPHLFCEGLVTPRSKDLPLLPNTMSSRRSRVVIEVATNGAVVETLRKLVESTNIKMVILSS